MYINSLKIRNFRNFSKAQLLFKKGVNTILGENGSGKTNALYAMRLLLDDSLPRNVVKLIESDFYRGVGDWKGQWIIISIDFSELAASEGCQMLKHAAGHMDQSDLGTLTYYYRPCLRIRQALYDYSGDLEAVNEIIESISIEDYEVLFTGRANADVLDDNFYTTLVGDFENGIFPSPTTIDLELFGTKVSPLHEEISFTFVKALRDVISDLKNYRSSPLINLLRNIRSDISSDNKDEIVDIVGELNIKISELEPIKKISAGIQRTLHDTVGHTFSPIVDIESSLSSDLEKLFQKLSLTVGDNNIDGYSGDLNELSLGGANLIYLALKLLEYEQKGVSGRSAQFLVIEEPEAHIHTHIQKSLFENHSVGKTQVFLSTHSTHISSASKISQMNILGITNGGIDVFRPSHSLTPQQCTRIERYLNATRSTLLFAKGVILVEGDAELILIPILIKSVFGVSLDELGISLISMDSAFFEYISTLFHKDRIRRNCAIVTDLDRSFVPLPENPEEDNEEQKSFRASQVSGEDRRNKLDKHVIGNKYLSVFYAENTFEVDFIGTDNSVEVIGALSKIYKRSSDIEQSIIKLDSNNLETYGREILRLANKEGKGWFALLLSEEVSSNTYIPQYIKRAIAHACNHKLDEAILMKICRYRIKNTIPLISDDQKPVQFFKDNADDFSACINKFVEQCPDDDASSFIRMLSRVK